MTLKYESGDSRPRAVYYSAEKVHKISYSNASDRDECMMKYFTVKTLERFEWGAYKIRAGL